jgi:hypothetical protein
VSAETSKGDLHPSEQYKGCGVVLEVPNVGDGYLYLVAASPAHKETFLHSLGILMGCLAMYNTASSTRTSPQRRPVPPVPVRLLSDSDDLWEDWLASPHLPQEHAAAAASTPPPAPVPPAGALSQSAATRLDGKELRRAHAKPRVSWSEPLDSEETLTATAASQRSAAARYWEQQMQWDRRGASGCSTTTPPSVSASQAVGVPSQSPPELYPENSGSWGFMATVLAAAAAGGKPLTQSAQSRSVTSKSSKTSAGSSGG